jgi:hypothetical protein
VLPFRGRSTYDVDYDGCIHKVSSNHVGADDLRRVCVFTEAVWSR